MTESRCRGDGGDGRVGEKPGYDPNVLDHGHSKSSDLHGLRSWIVLLVGQPLRYHSGDWGYPCSEAFFPLVLRAVF